MHTPPTPHNDVWTAIFTAAAAFPELPATAISPYGTRYTSLNDLLSVARPILFENQLLLTYTTSVDQTVLTVYQHIHLVGSSQQTTSEIQFILLNGSAHEIAGLLTGARRYLMAATFALALGNADDGTKTDLGSADLLRGKAANVPLPVIQPLPNTHGISLTPASSTPASHGTLGQPAHAVLSAASAANVQKGFLMHNLWTRLVRNTGKAAAEEILRLATGSPHIKDVIPDHFDLVMRAFEQRLSLPAPDDLVA